MATRTSIPRNRSERRSVQNRSHASGLRPYRVRVESPIDPRKAKAALAGRSCRWSVSLAATGMATDDDRALFWKDAQVRLYTIFLSGQTGMCPRARFPNPATRPKGGAL
jgi:hypothetical protein